MDDVILRLEASGPVATLTLNRQKQLNAFDAALRAELLSAVRKVEADPAIRVAILRGAGRGFCAGADLTEGFTGDISITIENEYRPFLAAIADGRKIWIAQVHGAAAGIGAALAMTCDLMTMADDATIYMAFAAIGLVPDGGNTWLLLNAMGYRHALQTILEGRKVGARECLAYGIANRILPGAELDRATFEWASKLAAGAPLAMAAAKQLLRANHARSLGEAISAEARAQNPLAQSKDFRNAVKSFFAKEKPVFKGE